MPRPEGAYFFVPGIWFGETTPETIGFVDALQEVVAARVVPDVGKITITREGLVWFDFSGTSLNANADSDDPFRDPERAVTLLTRRAQYMTAHSTCVAKAVFEHSNTIFASGTVVSSSKQIVAGGPSPPNATDPSLHRYCVQRWIFGQIVPYWENFGYGETSRTPLKEQDAVRSLELFEELVRLKDPIFPLNLIVRSGASLYEHDFVQALVEAWTATEICLDRLWSKLVDQRAPRGTADANRRRDQLLDTRTYTAAVRAEILSLSGLIDNGLYDAISAARRTRNAFLHAGADVTPGGAMAALGVARNLLRAAYQYDTPVWIGWGMHH